MNAERETARAEVKPGQVADLFGRWRLTEPELLDALRDIEWNPASKPPLPQRVFRWLGCPPWVCELVLETRTYLHRIGTLIRLRTVLLLGLGPSFGEDATGRLVICTRTQGRRLGIHIFQNTHCHSSPADLDIYYQPYQVPSEKNSRHSGDRICISREKHTWIAAK